MNTMLGCMMVLGAQGKFTAAYIELYHLKVGDTIFHVFTFRGITNIILVGLHSVTLPTKCVKNALCEV